jgi:hypothetical protein
VHLLQQLELVQVRKPLVQVQVQRLVEQLVEQLEQELLPHVQQR